MERLVAVGDRIALATLLDVDGAPVSLAEVVTRPTVIPLVRYYGCMPCQAYLRQLSIVRDELAAAGVDVIGVGGAADYQARHLRASGVEFPLLLDPEHALYAALNVHRIHWWKLLSVFTWVKYFRAARRARQGRITDHMLQAPGLVILDADLTVRFLYRGQTLGDYPPLADVLAAARQLSATAR